MRLRPRQLVPDHGTIPATNLRPSAECTGGSVVPASSGVLTGNLAGMVSCDRQTFDLWSVDLHAGATFPIHVWPPETETGADPVVTIFDPDGCVITVLSCTPDGDGVPDCPKLDVEATVSGTHTVVIEDQAACTPASVGRYLVWTDDRLEPEQVASGAPTHSQATIDATLTVE